MRCNTEKETRGEAVRSIENLGKSYHLLLLLDNYYLVNDDILLLVLFGNFGYWCLHEIIIPYEEYAFSEYSEWENMGKKLLSSRIPRKYDIFSEFSRWTTKGWCIFGSLMWYFLSRLHGKYGIVKEGLEN